jgi:hypothetical protein
MKPSGILYLAAFGTCMAAIITEAIEKGNAKRRETELWTKATSDGKDSLSSQQSARAQSS